MPHPSFAVSVLVYHYTLTQVPTYALKSLTNYTQKGKCGQGWEVLEELELTKWQYTLVVHITVVHAYVRVFYWFFVVVVDVQEKTHTLELHQTAKKLTYPYFSLSQVQTI